MKKSLAFGACLVAALTLNTQAQNILTDPGFENQTAAPNPNPTGVPGWSTFGGANFFQTPLAHSGNWVMDTPDAGGGYSVPGAFETFAATPGETFTLSGWVYTPNVLPVNGNDFAILQISFFAGTPPNNYGGAPAVGPAIGVNVGEPAGGGGVPLPQGTWTYASVSAPTPAGANSVEVFALDINADANADFYFDDLSLTVVPEPTTLALLGLGAAAMLAARRRQ
jgi:hypothetical protein